MKTILLIPGQLKNGGTEKHFYQLLCGLDRSKFKIIVVFFDCIQNEKGDIPNDVIVEVVKGGYISKSVEIFRIVSNYNVDLIYSCSFETSLPVLISRPFFLFSSVKFFTGVRGAFEFPWYRKLLEFFITFSSYKVITNSDKIKEYIPFVFHKKVITVYNGIEKSSNYISNLKLRSELGINPSTRVIGCIGRLDHKKGQDILLDAFSKAFYNNENVVLVLIGDGDEKDTLNLMANELGIKNRVFFLGNIINASEYLSLFDLFVLPSRFESFPNTLLEAIKNGLPIIASNVGGVEELFKLIDFGAIFNIKENGSLEKLMKEFLYEPRREYSFERFLLSTNIKSYENLFSS
jgi:glycosyltransferase involved in cell wall biosynthesis